MNILGQLFARIHRRKPARCAIVVGDGQFHIYVASTLSSGASLSGCAAVAPRTPVGFRRC